MSTTNTDAGEPSPSSFTLPICAAPSTSTHPASLPTERGKENENPSPISPTASAYVPRFCDIGINLTDPVFIGLYNGTQRHPSDLHDVVRRARDVGCKKLIVTGSDLKHSERALDLCDEFRKFGSFNWGIGDSQWESSGSTFKDEKADWATVYATIGVHPCNASSLTPSVLQKLEALADQGKYEHRVVAFGEIGLDYDRLELCPKHIQCLAFNYQLKIAVKLQLPLFLHCRAAHEHFMECLSIYSRRLPKRGVVHSFTGTLEEMQELVAQGWHIGVNGCSMKTEENCAVVKAIPLERLHIETDGPWCEIRPNPAMGWGGWKSVKKERWVEGATIKGRNEPCFIGRVAWAVAGIKGISVEEVCEAAWKNSVRMFGMGEELPREDRLDPDTEEDIEGMTEAEEKETLLKAQDWLLRECGGEAQSRWAEGM
ncbi:deoxyribonuclease Tat-D [Drepanopeziza brunnea f. sp. 'multigermtubi' MB_m1]|uniref:Deoxyribonuclease Tat-D n=1 Tax=Marssonina brunnea f. sp. multigermtubi (strain MB_m1) TaxID=1072389 RepID=K1WTY5_MARBU|nr:deoxyribonuclease Tat-D [Drepanopeziza brunnea f. sp. 'multigermtubi' MB_m1]EKD16516.1 deoxyribonuclease Tat-D [Drepanopeziza brunnea f. sp. 'multigermtubi' MB_m1]